MGGWKFVKFVSLGRLLGVGFMNFLIGFLFMFIVIWIFGGRLLGLIKLICGCCLLKGFMGFFMFGLLNWFWFMFIFFLKGVLVKGLLLKVLKLFGFVFIVFMLKVNMLLLGVLNCLNVFFGFWLGGNLFFWLLKLVWGLLGNFFWGLFWGNLFCMGNFGCLLGFIVILLFMDLFSVGFLFCIWEFFIVN